MWSNSKLLVAVAGLLECTSAVMRHGPRVERSGRPTIAKRQLPVNPVNVQTLTTPNGATITYKEPGKEGICETTPGVGSYSGYINLGADMHSFFYFFESRSDPANDPITLWLNGGPGSDSMIGLFQELGPCNVTANLTTMLNPYSWSNVSNMLFLSQPWGVGFSYEEEVPGAYDPETGILVNTTSGTPSGRWPAQNNTAIDTTDKAAMAGWEIIQGFLSGLPQLSSNVSSRVFNLATESYGGHYGPAFFNYFYEQNQMIKNGSANGTALEMNSLLIINGIIDEGIQVPYYPEFAINNTYNITAYNQSVYEYTQLSLYGPLYGCLAQIQYCYAYVDDISNSIAQAVCAEAADRCRDSVEGAYYDFGDRGTYDIRHPADDPTPPNHFAYFLDLDTTQEALGVNLNYSYLNTGTDIYYAFQQTGDFVFPNFLEDLEMILGYGVRVSLIYGDADYICNWFGGQAISLAANWTHQAQFAAAGYVPMVVDGVEYGETREYGNFSFTRIYESGHQVPYYQPIPALQLFNRTINNWDTATGTEKVMADLSTNGTAQATHTEPYVALSTSSSASGTSVPRAFRKPAWKH